MEFSFLFKKQKRKGRVNISKSRPVWGAGPLSSRVAPGHGAGSDEAGSLLLHVVLLVLLHPPADEEEQQGAQSLVAHLQAQIPVRQEDTGLVRACGGAVARVLGPRPPGRVALFSQLPRDYVVTTQVRTCHHPDGEHLPHSFDSFTRAQASQEVHRDQAWDS